MINTIIPIRCFTCGKPLGGLWEKYQEKIKAGEKPGKVLDEFGLERYCCRALLLTHTDLLEKVAKFRT